MDLGLRDRVAIVTGSSRGIGRAVAAALAGEGVRVVLNGRTTDVLEASAAELRGAGGTVHPVLADVTSQEGCERLVQEAVAAFGGIDILVNNVGGSLPSPWDAPDSEWDESLDRIFWPALRMSRLVAPYLRQQRRGVIVMIASIYGREWGGRPTYQVGKSAEISLAKAMARQLAPEGIRVLSVAPGSILFPGGVWWRRREADPVAMDEFVRLDMPLGRFGRPEEVGDVVAFLCSDRASLVTGACIPVDGCQGRSLL